MSEQTRRATYCPDCGSEVWDTATIDQRLNKCWTCGLRFMNDPDEPEAFSEPLTKPTVKTATISK